MKTLAIIAEYNPFHNGHLHHLRESLTATKAHRAISIMSGNFLQRGEPAIIDKYERASMCVKSGVDLALELPFPYATGSAMDFSMGAVSILNKLNFVDFLCFGAETPDINLFYKVCDVILSEPDSYKNTLKDYLSKGLSYPAAREKAIINYFEDLDIAEFISSPNNILGLEYVMAIMRTNSAIKPIVIPRKQAGYHDKNIYESISSASALREAVKNSTNPLDAIKKDIPLDTYSILESAYQAKWPIYAEWLTPFLQSALMSNSNFSHICDISEKLSNKILKLAPNTSYSLMLEALKSKDLTSTRICRSIIHLIIGYTESLRTDFISKNYAFYANILGLKKESSSLLKEIQKSSLIPLINKKANFDKIISEHNIDHHLAKSMWELDTKATDLYNCLIYNQYGYTNKNDYTTKLPII